MEWRLARGLHQGYGKTASDMLVSQRGFLLTTFRINFTPLMAAKIFAEIEKLEGTIASSRTAVTNAISNTNLPGNQGMFKN